MYIPTFVHIIVYDIVYHIDVPSRSRIIITYLIMRLSFEWYKLKRKFVGLSLFHMANSVADQLIGMIFSTNVEDKVHLIPYRDKIQNGTIYENKSSASVAAVIA